VAVKKKEPQSDQEVAEWYQASIMAAVSEYCRQLGMSAVAESIVQQQTHPRFHEALTAFRELEVSLQALKEENAMLRDEQCLADAKVAEMHDTAMLRERAAVVAWLRERAARRGFTVNCPDELAWCADTIERGEHRREEGS